MIDTALKLQVPITALCALQQLDINWATLHNLLKLFYIFVRPTEKLQGSSYPSLNYAVLQYMRMIKKLKDMRSELLERSLIATATSIALKKLNVTLNYAVLQYMRMIKKLEDMRSRESDIQAVDIMNSIEAEDLDIEQAINIDIDSEDELYILQSRYNIEPEWKQWMKEPTVGRDTDILKYWQTIPATLADLERVFSVGGDIITKKRN
ncbi:hypothetical protein V499_01093 [Pseudogymnoascus sp. VKM F-103]|nr:hypothetical protein V499_01093 [Pseudogymnoascus sp. VKM F-103]